MKDRLILKNGDAIEIESASSLSEIRVVSASKAAMISIWDKLSNENLKAVQIKNVEDAVIGEYADLVLESETSVIQKDNSVLTRFHLREKTEVELLREEMEVLKTGQEIHDGAIADLGEVVSVMAQQQEVAG